MKSYVKNLIYNILLVVYRVFLSRIKIWNILIELLLYESEYVYDSRYGFLSLIMIL